MFNLALPHHRSPVKIHSTASSVKSVKPVELFPLTVNAPHLSPLVLQVHQDHQDQPETQGNQGDLDNPDKTVDQEKQLHRVLHKTRPVNLAQQDHQEAQGPTDSQDHPDRTDNQEHQESEAAVAHLDLPGRVVTPVQTVNQDHLVNQEAQDKTEPVQPHLQDQRDQTEAPDQADPPDPMVTLDSQEAKVNQVQPVQTEIPDNQEAMVNQGKLGQLDYQVPMPHTARAHQELPSSCTVNRLEQFSELQHTTAIIFLLFVEKMKKDFIFKKV